MQARDRINSKPVTAAPVTYDDSGAKAIKKITGEGDRRARFASTSNAFRSTKSPSNLPVNNSLLSADEKGMYTNMKPIGEYFDQMFEETHYMFPKHKSKFGVKLSQPPNSTKNKSVSRPHKVEPIVEIKMDEDDQIISELREQSSKFITPKYKHKIMKREQEIRNKIELEKLLEKSLKYHKEKVANKEVDIENLTDEDKLNIIMATWLTDDPNDPAYIRDSQELEAKLTSHMILNTRNNKSIYPEDIKDAEIEIYMRNRKHAPKYEMLQYIKFSGANGDEEDSCDMNELSDYDLNVG